jgi:hypothetical protein
VVGWYESTNLWDYLLDPFVAGYAFVVVVGGAKDTFKLSKNRSL